MRTKWVNAALLLVVVSLAGSGILVLADDASAVGDDSGSRLYGENTGDNGVTATYLDGRLTISSSDFNSRDTITLKVDDDLVFENYTYVAGDDVWTSMDLSVGVHSIFVSYSEVKYDLFALEVRQQYYITFVDGEKVYQEGWVDKDTMPVYNGVTPARADTPYITYAFTGWEPSIGVATGSETYEAQFSETDILYDVEVTAGTGGTASASPTQVKAGGTVTLTATPSSGYSFDRWVVVSGEVSITGNSFSMPTSDVKVRAEFVQDSPGPTPDPPITTTYRVIVETDGNGTAAASPSTATAGTTITLTAIPNEGYVFKGWETTSGITITGNIFTMPSKNVTVKAVFEKPTVIVDVTFDRTAASIGVGDTLTIVATVTPADAPDRSLVWSTSDPSVVTVDNGIVTAVGPGTAKVTATTVSGKTATCTVTVTMTDVVIKADDGQISGSQISEILDKVVLGQNVVLDANGSSELSVDVDPVLALLDKGVVVIVSTDAGSVQIPKGALVEVPAGQPMVVNLTDMEVPKDFTGKVPEGSVVVDVTITVGDMVVTTFGTPITISIPVGDDVKDTSNLKVYHLADDGTMTDMNATYDKETNSMVFQTGHLSVYAIVEEVPAPSDDKDNTLLCVAVVVVIVVIVALAAVMVMRKKN